VLRAAVALAPVHEFGWRRPSLAELFRDVVTRPQPEDEAAAVRTS